MRNIIYALIILAALIVQSALPTGLKPWGIKPNLLLFTALMAGISCRGNMAAFLLSLWAGILADSMSARAWGLNTLIFPIWVFAARQFSRKLSADNLWVRTALVFLVVWLNSLVIFIISLFSGKFIPPGIVLRISFVEATYTSLLLLAWGMFWPRTLADYQ